MMKPARGSQQGLCDRLPLIILIQIKYKLISLSSAGLSILLYKYF